MATIKILNLHTTGTELFSDSESYMNELGDNELNNTNGGIRLHTTTHMLTLKLSRHLRIPL